MKVEINIHKEISNIIHNELKLSKKDIIEKIEAIVEAKTAHFIQEYKRKHLEENFEKAIARSVSRELPHWKIEKAITVAIEKIVKDNFKINVEKK